MERNRYYYFLFAPLLIFSSCQKELLVEEFPNTPTGNFDALWSEYDRTYAAFEAKNINWDSLYPIYRNRIDDNSTEYELHNALTGLLSELKDGHIQLTASYFKRFYSAGIKTLYPDSKLYENAKIINDLFDLDKKEYLTHIQISKNFMSAYVSNSKSAINIGYLFIPTFSYDSFDWDFVEKALDNFKNADGIVLDLRFNGGGATETFLKLLNKLSDKKRLYIRSRLRNGPKQNDYTGIFDHYYEPVYGTFEPKPVVLLVNRFSGSSSEHFTLGIQSMPYGIVVGDTTYGALSTVLEKILPNGWSFRTSPQVLCDSTGNFLKDSKGRYPDGVGLAPDIYVVNYYEDIKNKKDYILERAIKVIDEKFANP